MNNCGRCASVADVDGVLTDGGIAFDGEGRPFRTAHVRDVTVTCGISPAGERPWCPAGQQGVEAIAATRGDARNAACGSRTSCGCEEIAANYGLTMKELAFIGDDIIDVRAMQAVGVGVAVADARWRPGPWRPL